MASETWVPSPLPLTVGSSVAGLAEALCVGSLVDTTNGKTETTRGKQEGAATPMWHHHLAWAAGTLAESPWTWFGAMDKAGIGTPTSAKPVP